LQPTCRIIVKGVDFIKGWGTCAVSDTVRHPNLLQYWSIRYFLIITASVAVMMLFSLYIIRTTAADKQTRGLEAMAREVASMAADSGGILPKSPTMHNTLENLVKQHGLSGRPILFILDSDGRIRQQEPTYPPDETTQFGPLLPQIMTDSARILEFKPASGGDTYMIAVQPMLEGASVTGYVLYFEKKQAKLRELFSNSPKFILLSLFLLIGWVTVYAMTRRLVSPIREVAEAAKQVVAGSYNINLNKAYKEAEIYDLTHSFNEMANRLAHLEALRSQLLTGITKELMTPVASIQRNVQAVKDRQISAEEANAYLGASLEESRRLQSMIENLLEFNRYITSEVSVIREKCNLDTLMTEVIDRWSATQHDKRLTVVKHTAADRNHWQTWTDPARVEQILVNLLNNAKDAMTTGGTVNVLLCHEAKEIRIHVQDTGRGIPQDEYADIFEPFYRGSDNKTHLRGLGIGLPFSKLIARSLGGDLVLSDGTPGQTTFTLILSSDR